MRGTCGCCRVRRRSPTGAPTPSGRCSSPTGTRRRRRGLSAAHIPRWRPRTTASPISTAAWPGSAGVVAGYVSSISSAGVQPPSRPLPPRRPVCGSSQPAAPVAPAQGQRTHDGREGGAQPEDVVGSSAVAPADARSRSLCWSRSGTVRDKCEWANGCDADRRRGGTLVRATSPACGSRPRRPCRGCRRERFSAPSWSRCRPRCCAAELRGHHVRSSGWKYSPSSIVETLTASSTPSM